MHGRSYVGNAFRALAVVGLGLAAGACAKLDTTPRVYEGKVDFMPCSVRITPEGPQGQVMVVKVGQDRGDGSVRELYTAIDSERGGIRGRFLRDDAAVTCRAPGPCEPRGKSMEYALYCDDSANGFSSPEAGYRNTCETGIGNISVHMPLAGAHVPWNDIPEYDRGRVTEINEIINKVVDELVPAGGVQPIQ